MALSFRTAAHCSRTYNQNLAFYAAFVLCLTSYIFVMYGGRAIRGDAAVLSEACAADEGGGGVPREAAVLWHVNAVLLVILGKLGEVTLNSTRLNREMIPRQCKYNAMYMPSYRRYSLPLILIHAFSLFFEREENSL